MATAAAGVKTEKQRGLLWKRLKKQRAIQAFVLVGIAYLIVFNYAPMVGILVAFKKYSIQDGFWGIFLNPWADKNGFANFIEFFTDYKFGTVLKNTLGLSLLKIVATFPAPILLAIMVNEVRNTAYKRFVQAVSYLPHFISWVIIAGMMSAFFSETRGIVNEALVWLGVVPKGLPFLSSPDYYWSLATVSSVWKSTGWWSIIFLAAIAGIDPNLYEAAQIDGAGRLKRIWHITLPGMLPSIMVVLILTVGSLLSGGMAGGNFDQAMVLGNEMNNSASELVQTYAFRTGMVDLRFNYAAAIDLIQSIISLSLIFVSNTLSRKFSGTSLY